MVRNAEGGGPVAALFAALAAATGVDFELESYEVHSMGVGRDARGEANLSARIDGRMLSGQGTSRDVLEASAIAWLDVANHMLRERQALRGSLVAYNARPAAHGLAEDVELARLYRQARDILWQAPCDLTVARSAVDRFQRAVRLRLDDTSGGLGREFL